MSNIIASSPNRKFPVLRRRLLLFRCVSVCGTLILCFAIPEAVTRILAPPVDQYYGCYFGKDPNSPDLFMVDTERGWSLRPKTEVKFLATLVSTNSLACRGSELLPSRKTVICLGDSSTFGWKVNQGDSYPARLERLLESNPETTGKWQVLNAGVPGYCSLQIRATLQLLLEQVRPEVVIVCASNNETWPVSPDTKLRRPTLDSSLRRFLRQSYFLRWAGGQVSSRQVSPFSPHGASEAVNRVDREVFESEIEKMIRLSRQSGARTILLAPPANLRMVFPGNDSGEWEIIYNQVFAMIDQKQVDKANQFVERLANQYPESHHPIWLRGFLLDQSGKQDEARRDFEKAFEIAPFLDRCRPSYRRTLQSVALRESIPFVEANDLMRSHMSEFPDTFLDHCHPTVEGHQRIAKGLLRIMESTEQSR